MLQDQVIAKKDEIKWFLKNLWLDVKNISNEEMMLQSFVHKSYAADFKNKKDHNERLEFVWDGILWAVINKLLFLSDKDLPESDLTLYKIALVREETLAQVGRDIWLDKMLFISKWEEKTEWRKKDVIIADWVEALIWFIYIDLWFQSTENFIQKHIFSKLEEVKKLPVKSYKTMLQEIIQKQFKILPDYIDTEFQKDDKLNVLIYKTEIYLSWEKKSEWLWSNKKKSQEEAAKNYYEKLVLDAKS